VNGYPELVFTNYDYRKAVKQRVQAEAQAQSDLIGNAPPRHEKAWPHQELESCQIQP
jgi:hypothetical protein